MPTAGSRLLEFAQESGQYLDSRRMKGIPDHAIERELQACAAGRIKNLKRLLFVNRKAQVLDIK